MTPKSFDIETCRAMLDPPEIRWLEAPAVKDLESGNVTEFSIGQGYWLDCKAEFQRIYYEHIKATKQAKSDRMNQEFIPDNDLIALVQSAMNLNQRVVDQYKLGNTKAIGAIVGQCKKLNATVDPIQIKLCVDYLLKL